MIYLIVGQFNIPRGFRDMVCQSNTHLLEPTTVDKSVYRKVPCVKEGHSKVVGIRLYNMGTSYRISQPSSYHGNGIIPRRERLVP